MAEEVYDGAIGIDLGKDIVRARPTKEILTDRRHDLLLRRQL